MPEPAAIPDADVVSGLDALQQEPAAPARQPWRRAAPFIALLVIVLLWQAVSALGPADGLPAPRTVLSSLAGMASDGTAGWALATSVARGVVGFAAAVLIGSFAGLVLALSTMLRTAIGPLLLAVQTLPSVAWVPFAVLWFDRSDAAMYAVVVAGAAPAIASGLLAGLDQVPPLLLGAGRSLGAQRWSLTRFVLLPGAAPGYLAGLKQGWAFSWRALMAAELVVGAFGGHPGLGQLLTEGKDRSDLSQLTAVVLLILLVGLAVELGVFGPLERRVLARRGLTGGPA